MKFEWPQAELYWYPDFLSPEESSSLFQKLHSETNWRSGEIKLFGKTHAIPRLECYYAKDGLQYGYSGRQLELDPIPEYLLPLLKRVESQSGASFNAVLLNYYRNERDSNGWHADNEKELGINPVIASLSLGETRIFQCKHKTLPLRKNLELTSGSLLIMAGEMQHHWKHQIAKSSKQIGPRINLTFRKILVNY
jgi:alkylated DNA repair dioxygenase AlkB